MRTALALCTASLQDIFGRPYIWNLFSHNSDIDAHTGYNGRPPRRPRAPRAPRAPPLPSATPAHDERSRRVR